MGNFKAISVRVFFSKFLIFVNMSSEREFSKTFGLIVARALVYEQDYSSFVILFGKIIVTAGTCLLTTYLC